MVMINNGIISHNDNSINIVGNFGNIGNIITNANNCKSRIFNHFDEKVSLDARSAEKIVIDSDVEVSMSASNSSMATVHFYGQADIAEEALWFDARIVEHELRVQVKLIGDCYNSSLKLDIKVPYKTFKAIIADTTSADFSLHEGVSMESLRINTIAGDIKLKLYAAQNIEVGISTVSGNIEAAFSNMRFKTLYINSLSGTVRDCHKSENGYSANINISTTCGNITLY